MKLTLKNISIALLVVAIILAMFIPVAMLSNNSSNEVAFAAEAVATAEEGETPEVEVQPKADNTAAKAIAAAIVVGIVATAGAIGMAMAISKSVEGIARQPEADGKIRTSLMLGLVFIETAIIYALIVAILIIFVM